MQGGFGGVPPQAPERPAAGFLALEGAAEEIAAVPAAADGDLAEAAAAEPPQSKRRRAAPRQALQGAFTPSPLVYLLTYLLHFYFLLYLLAYSLTLLFAINIILIAIIIIFQFRPPPLRP